MKYAIFGAGSSGVMALNFLGYEFVDCFVDNHKYGQQYLGKPVIDYVDFLAKENRNDLLLIIASEQHWADIEAQVKKSGLKYYFVFRERDRDCIWKELSLYKRFSSQQSMIYMDILALCGIKKWNKIAVYGSNTFIPYLLMAIAVQKSEGTFRNIVGVIDPYGCYKDIFGVKAISFREAIIEADCFIVNVPFGESNGIRDELEKRGIAQIDLYNPYEERLQTIVGGGNIGMSNNDFLARVKRGLALYGELEAKYSRAKILLLECNSMGDPYFYASLIPTYVQKEGIEDYVFLFCRDTLKPIVASYGLRHFQTLPWRDLTCLSLLYRLMSKNLNMVLLHKTESLIWRVGSVKRFDLLHIIKTFTLGLSKNIPLRSTNVPSANWCSRYPQLCSAGVLLAPKAKTTGEQSETFWLMLVARLIKSGFVVYCNVGPNEEALPNTIPLSIAPEDIVSVAEKIGCVIALRSGFCDLLAEAHCKKIILYNDVRIYWNHVDEIEIFSLNKCGLCQDAEEIVLSGDWKTDVTHIYTLVCEKSYHKKIHLVMPMAGAGSRFQGQGSLVPKPLIMLHGKPFFYWAAISVLRTGLVKDVRFVVLQQHIDEFHIDEEIKKYFPEAEIIALSEILPGPVLTCLEGIKGITDRLPILFNDCDHLFACRRFYHDLQIGQLEHVGGTVFTFYSQLPQYSYLRFGKNDRIIGTVEKMVASSAAIYGAYVFQSAALFCEIAKEYINNCPYQECFMSGLYNVLCEHDLPIQAYAVDYHLEFGTPAELAEAEQDDLWESKELQLLSKGENGR